MTSDEKVRMAHQLDRLGVDAIEAGFPISSDGDFHAVQSVAREVRRPVIAALARCRREDIERAGRRWKVQPVHASIRFLRPLTFTSSTN